MFTMAYRIIHHDEDEMIGESGFFRITCGEAAYGEWWPEELWHVMLKVWLGSWFENLLDACLPCNIRLLWRCGMRRPSAYGWNGSGWGSGHDECGLCPGLE